MSFIHCFLCGVRKNNENRIYLTNCCHTFCKPCIESNGKFCSICKRAAKFIEVSQDMPRGVRFLFEDLETHITKAKMASDFQISQFRHFMASRQTLRQNYETELATYKKIIDATRGLQEYAVKEKDLMKRLKIAIQGNDKVYNRRSMSDSIFDSPNTSTFSILNNNSANGRDQSSGFYDGADTTMDVDVEEQPNNMLSKAEQEKILMRFKNPVPTKSPQAGSQKQTVPPQHPQQQPKMPAPTFQYNARLDIERNLPSIIKRKSPKQVPLRQQIVTKEFVRGSEVQPQHQQPFGGSPSNNNPLQRPQPRGFSPSFFQPNFSRRNRN